MKPTLVILAAGMASRYGSMKQVDGFGPSGETIIDYSIYDAIDAGFGKVVFIIREEFKDKFAEIFEPKLKGKVEVDYAFQSYDLSQFGNYKMGYSTPVFSPTGGMKISAADLARYAIMHMNYGESNGVRIIPKKLSKLMQKKISEKEGYGMSIMNFNDLVPGVHLTGHTGSAYGLYSAMFFNPQKKFAIVVITNGCNVPESDDVHPILKKTINCLYDNFIR